MGVRFQNATQMRLAQDNHMIDALAPDRSDQPFGKAILPRRGWRGRLVPDAHGAQSACDDRTIDPIPVAETSCKTRQGQRNQAQFSRPSTAPVGKVTLPPEDLIP